MVEPPSYNCVLTPSPVFVRLLSSPPTEDTNPGLGEDCISSKTLGTTTQTLRLRVLSPALDLPTCPVDSSGRVPLGSETSKQIDK